MLEVLQQAHSKQWHPYARRLVVTSYLYETENLRVSVLHQQVRGLIRGSPPVVGFRSVLTSSQLKKTRHGKKSNTRISPLIKLTEEKRKIKCESEHEFSQTRQ
jgi:hypothetical protein